MSEKPQLTAAFRRLQQFESLRRGYDKAAKSLNALLDETIDRWNKHAIEQDAAGTALWLVSVDTENDSLTEWVVRIIPRGEGGEIEVFRVLCWPGPGPGVSNAEATDEADLLISHAEFRGPRDEPLAHLRCRLKDASWELAVRGPNQTIGDVMESIAAQSVGTLMEPYKVKLAW